MENGLFKHGWRRRSRVEILQYIFLKWLLAFLVGVLTGIIATLINLAVENIVGHKLLAVLEYIHRERLDSKQTSSFSLKAMAIMLRLGSPFLLSPMWSRGRDQVERLERCGLELIERRFMKRNFTREVCAPLLGVRRHGKLCRQSPTYLTKGPKQGASVAGVTSTSLAEYVPAAV